jgi:hypothetical protein
MDSFVVPRLRHRHTAGSAITLVNSGPESSLCWDRPPLLPEAAPDLTPPGASPVGVVRRNGLLSPATGRVGSYSQLPQVLSPARPWSPLSVCLLKTPALERGQIPRPDHAPPPLWIRGAADLEQETRTHGEPASRPDAETVPDPRLLALFALMASTVIMVRQEASAGLAKSCAFWRYPAQYAPPSSTTALRPACPQPLGARGVTEPLREDPAQVALVREVALCGHKRRGPFRLGVTWKPRAAKRSSAPAWARDASRARLARPEAIHQTLPTRGYPHLAQGPANLAARGWPKWQRAHDVLKAQDYLPLLDAQRLRTYEGKAPQTDPATDRRRLRGRAT